MANQSSVAKLYQTVIDDVINNVREAFLDEGVDEQVLQELKQIWESKLAQSKALDQPVDPHMLQYTSQQQGAAAAQVTYASTEQLQPTMTPAAQAATMALPEGILAYQAQHLGTVAQAITLPTAGSGTQTYPAYQVAQIRQAAGAPGQPQLVYQQVPLHDVAALQAAQQQQQQQQRTQTTTTLVHQPTQIHQTTQPPGQRQQQAQQIVGQVQSTVPNQAIIQVDGGNDTSSEDEEDEEEYHRGRAGKEEEEDDDDDDDDDDENENDNEGGEDEEPLNSEDDVDDEDPAELFDTENVVVCQYDKINRSRNKWKFHLKDGIMNLQGKDYVFQKAIGDAEW